MELAFPWRLCEWLRSGMAFVVGFGVKSADGLPVVLGLEALFMGAVMAGLVWLFPDAPPTPSGPSNSDSDMAEKPAGVELKENSQSRAGSAVLGSSPSVGLSEAAEQQAAAAPVPRKWRRDISALVHNPRFMLLAATFGLTFGIFNGWMAILSLLLNPLGFSVDATSALGLLMEVLGMVMGVMIGELGDRVSSLKWLFWGLLVAASTSLFFFSLLVSLAGSELLVGAEYNAAFAMCLIGGVIMNASPPLLYEMVSYDPARECGHCWLAQPFVRL